MTKSFLLKIFDTAFVAFSSFIVFFVILNYFLGYSISIVLSVCFGLITALFAFKAFTEKNREKDAKEKKEKEVERVLGTLCFTPQKDLTALFSKLFINFERKKGGFFDQETLTLFTPIFKFEGLTKTDIVKVYNKISKDEKAVIYTAYCKSETLDFCALFNGKIQVVYYEKVYDELSSAGLIGLIRKDLNFSPAKKRASFRGFINKKHAKKFFAFGVLFLGFSFIVPFKLYYIVSGCLFITLSIVCKFFGKAVKTVSA